MKNKIVFLGKIFHLFLKKMGFYKLLYKPKYKNMKYLKKSREITEEKLNSFYKNIMDKAIYINEIEYFNFYKDIILEKADTYLNNEFLIFDKNFKFENSIKWNISENNNFYPNAHFSKISLNYKKFGDIKYTWELNKLWYLQYLAIAFYLTGNRKYSQKIFNDINNWIDNNPPEFGVNWINDQEISYRIISVIYALQLIKEDIPTNLLEKLYWLFIESGNHINKEIDYTIKYVPNNHVIGAASGLYLISEMLTGSYYEADKWNKKSRKILLRYIDIFINEDGAYDLQSPNYHLVIILFLISIFNLSNQELKNIIKRTFIKSLEYFETVSVNKIIPQIGAWDSGRPLIIYSLPKEDSIDLLLRSMEKIVNFKENNNQKKVNKKFFSYSNGINIIENGKTKLFFIAGNHKIFSQRHADYLGILLYYKNIEILADSGNFKYNVEEKWNNYFRGSFSHNTFIVDNIPLNIPVGTFRWSEYPEAKILNISNSEIEGIVENKSYIARRKIKFINENEIHIDDSVDKYKIDRFKIVRFFHFSKEDKNDIKIINNQIILKIRNVKIELDFLQNSKIELFFGNNNPVFGWNSKRYGGKRGSLTIVQSNITKLKEVNKVMLRIKENEK
ncbi:Heparinase II/III N-terminus [Marinitoga hydrogenitolerans DSM 16785]|uniref:Heparinase II/III N-terminus n=1 Tax=Marinitoga hydrogenitolerans (strain DSM 16785 / JCM 12826 / AT1271) TaxID=1122195 RepID=A0A1M4YY71_MARH1|nr:heparinase II/III family protein [Marinitoga hydrogenitolerans]SHF10452.1 Heparinase II/III N-terminus [Marinitoga hydrogenitolerans DSM 16785]